MAGLARVSGVNAKQLSKEPYDRVAGGVRSGWVTDNKEFRVLHDGLQLFIR